MLCFEWEIIFEKIINSTMLKEDLIEIIDKYITKYSKGDGKILIGHDTRETSIPLTNLIIKGLSSLECKFINYGLVTTPQLHFLTYLTQKQLTLQLTKSIQTIHDYYNLDYDITKNMYFVIYKDILAIFHSLLEKINLLVNRKCDKYTNNILIDCSNGISGSSEIKDNMNNFNEFLNLTFINTEVDKNELLNLNCGAEFVQKSFSFPENYSLKNSFYSKSCSFDGDADRIVYL